MKKTNCKECEAHDLETKRLMNSLFSKEEIILTLVALIMDVKVRQHQLKSFKPTDIRSEAIKRDIANMAALIGKHMVALDRKQRSAVIKSMERQGIQMDIEHESCPHRVDKTVDKKQIEA